ncbi:hypothetical protein M115_3101 [Bacteroides fragilis str. 3719 T6]|nr:hypothetical protein M101_3063 [Bacteroides fragilis str. 1007-1-F \
MQLPDKFHNSIDGRKFQCSDVLDKVKRIWDVGIMGKNGVLVMVHTTNNFRTSITIQAGLFHAFGQATGTTEQVYDKQFYIGQTFQAFKYFF